MQTPQTFRVEIIRRALSEVRRRDLLVTDDTAACELIGQPVRLVLSPQPNPKVTRPEDLPYVEALLRAGAPVATGHNGGAGFVPGIPRLHLPDINLADSAVGVRMAAPQTRRPSLL